MTTCPSCGSETAADVTCVVCGAEPAGSTSPAEAPAATEPVDPTRAMAAGDHQPEQLVGAASAAGAGGPAVGAGPTGPTASPGGVAPGPGPTDPPPPPTPGNQVAPAWPATPAPHVDAIAISENSRNWGMIAHLSALVAAGLGGLGFLGPLVVWLVRKDQDRYVAHHAVEALNFNLSMMLYAILAVLLAFTIVLIPVSILMAVLGAPFWFIASIVAAVKAQRGEGFRYPLAIRLVKE